MHTSVAAYLAKLEEPRRAEVKRLHELISGALPDAEVRVAGALIGYGPYHYRYESGTEGDSFRVSLASRKTGLSIYVAAVDEGGWLAEQAKASLGKARVGKSCIAVKRLEDLDLAGLVTLLKRARKVKAPGEVKVSPSR